MFLINPYVDSENVYNLMRGIRLNSTQDKDFLIKLGYKNNRAGKRGVRLLVNLLRELRAAQTPATPTLATPALETPSSPESAGSYSPMSQDDEDVVPEMGSPRPGVGRSPRPSVFEHGEDVPLIGSPRPDATRQRHFFEEEEEMPRMGSPRPGVGSSPPRF